MHIYEHVNNMQACLVVTHRARMMAKKGFFVSKNNIMHLGCVEWWNLPEADQWRATTATESAEIQSNIQFE